MLPEYHPEPMLDWNDAGVRAQMQAAITAVRGQLGQRYPLRIGGEQILTEQTIDSINPGNPEEVVGRVASADVALATRAIEAADAAFPQWRAVPAEARARVLFKAAAIMRRRRFELMAWMAFEASKTWPEADGEVAEAIDFCEFYGREMLRLSGPQPLTPYPGEENELFYIPLGAGLAIPPWNFSLAIMVGLTVAPLVAGNTVVLKPASVTPVIAAKFMEILDEAGLPPGIVQFCPGPGGSVGDTLVDHPRTRFIAFTGSKEVGLRINERASVRQPGQLWIKRTVLEMGGKDAIVVDESADLDAAAQGIVQSAFGFQGQKCSACSRAIIVDAVYDTVLDKVVELARKLTVGDVTGGEVDLGAVIDQKAYTKIKEYIQIGANEGRLVLGGETNGGAGYYIPPTIIADVPEQARLAQEEVFGPVLAVIRARDWSHALEVANNTEYGLTGAVYARERRRLEEARDAFHVGNLYFNRKCTGALVGVHPFGGFNMSGTDSKAGGRDYLLLFLQAKVVSERF
jgi:1-pyrroline-5-carboxylate dehydrogenase